MRSFFMLVLLGVILATIAIVVRSGMLARENPGRPINSTMRMALNSPQLSTEDALFIAQKYPTANRLESGLQYQIKQFGEGPTPIKGQIVTVHYTGYFLNGEKFDSSVDRGAPFNFQVGFNRVISGWDEAASLMRKGEKRTLIVPYWLGYGEKGRGKIPPKSTLILDIEVLDIR